MYHLSLTILDTYNPESARKCVLGVSSHTSPWEGFSEIHILGNYQSSRWNFQSVGPLLCTLITILDTHIPESARKCVLGVLSHTSLCEGFSEIHVLGNYQSSRCDFQSWGPLLCTLSKYTVVRYQLILIILDRYDPESGRKCVLSHLQLGWKENRYAANGTIW